MVILTKMGKMMMTGVVLLCTISEVSFHRYVSRKDPENATSPCSPLLCAHLIDNSNIATSKCALTVNECSCYKDEWNSPMYCRKFNRHPFMFFYEKNNRFLGFHCRPEISETFFRVSQYISRFLDVIVPWITFELSECCAKGIPTDVVKGGKDYPKKIERLFSTLDLTLFPLINRPATVLNFHRNCLANITGKFSTAFPTLKAVDLGRNFITIIPENTFADLKNLETLDLNYNRIQYIDRSALENLTSLTHLFLSYNEIENITEDAFRSQTNLNKIELKGNKLETLLPKTFHGNNNLEKIYLSSNKIKNIPSDLFSTLFKLTEVDLANNEIHSISDKLFFGLTKLTYVFLNNNKLTTISPIQFTSNFDIRRINISQNYFEDVPSFTFTWALNKGPEILAFANKISSLHVPLVPHIMQAKIVDISRNNITYVNDSDWTSLGHITDPNRQNIENIVCRYCGLTEIHAKMLVGVTQSADFSNNLINKIDMDLLRNIAHLKKVVLVNNDISTITLNWSYPIIQDNTRKPPLNNPSTEIIIKNNRLNCDCLILPLLKILNNKMKPPHGKSRSNMRFQLTEVICGEPPDLRGLSVMYLVRDNELKAKLVCNVTSVCPQLCQCYYAAVQEITVVNCAELGLHHFPDLTLIKGEIALNLQQNRIQNLPHKSSEVWVKILELILSDNKITDLENLVISSSLKKLDLQQNLLKDLTDVVSRFVLPYPNTSIMLGQNPWECNCDVLKIRPLLFSAGNLIDVNQISCYLSESEGSVLLTNVTDYQMCPELFVDEKDLMRVLIPTVAGFIVLISVCLTVLYRYKAEVQLWLFTRGYCLRFVAEEDIDGNKIYDAFVSYSSLDDEWVAKTLVPGLEQGTPAYRLCLHDRDWPVGEWIPDQIMRSVESSRRTIIVLTDNFIESDWSRLEFHAAYKQALTDQVNRVLIVIPGELPNVEKLDYELRSYVTLNTYIKWSEPHFWRKLRCAMPKTKVPQ